MFFPMGMGAMLPFNIPFLNGFNNNGNNNPTLDLSTIIPNASTVNLVFYNSKFNDFNMGPKKRQQKKKQKNETVKIEQPIENEVNHPVNNITNTDNEPEEKVNNFPNRNYLRLKRKKIKVTRN